MALPEVGATLGTVFGGDGNRLLASVSLAAWPRPHEEVVAGHQDGSFRELLALVMCEVLEVSVHIVWKLADVPLKRIAVVEHDELHDLLGELGCDSQGGDCNYGAQHSGAPPLSPSATDRLLVGGCFSRLYIL